MSHDAEEVPVSGIPEKMTRSHVIQCYTIDYKASQTTIGVMSKLRTLLQRSSLTMFDPP
ncbi:MAG: hypothetical protein LBI62_02680 [Candidatus Accumulibacter sp.]|jgi:hypothetical protein|nr:hypothetical protein [Accumulibacter sp.]